MKRALLFAAAAFAIPHSRNNPLETGFLAAGGECGPSNKGECMEEKCAPDQTDVTEFGYACDDGEVCCVPTKTAKMLGGFDVVKMNQATWRIVTPGFFGIDKAFVFTASANKIDIKGRKGHEESAFLDKKLFGAKGLGLSFESVKDGVSHAKSTSKGFWKGKYVSPAVQVRCANCGGLSIEDAMKAVNIQGKPDKAQSVLFETLKDQMKEAMIVDENIDKAEISPAESKKFLTSVAEFFCENPRENGGALECA